jgi:molybdopterin converting factor subunit 1
MNKIKVLFFATLRQRAGAREIDLEVPEALDVRGLRQRLAGEFPDLRSSLGTVLVAINREYAFDEALIPLNAEVALFPPVSGG